MLQLLPLILVATNIYFVTPIPSEEGETKESISSIFEGLGYSSTCVASCLASCEISAKANDSNKDSGPVEIAQASLAHQNSTFTTNRAKNCEELQAMGDSASGVRTVFPYDCCSDRKVKVYCDQTTDGGGWTVIQNRDALPLREDFYRTWIEYVLGFGNVTGEYWLGLDNIHALVSSTLMELRVDLTDYDDVKRWAKYGVFYVGDSTAKYALSIGRYSGDAGDSLAYQNGMKFSTHDHDNDKWSDNCAKVMQGAWWYQSCHLSSLNGYPYVGKYTYTSDGQGIVWRAFRAMEYSLKRASLKIRPMFRY